MRRSARAILGCLVALCVMALPAADASAEPALPEGFQDTVVFDHLEEPTNFRFAQNGEVFVAEKPGKILLFESLHDTEPEVFADLRTDVYQTGDRGLLGIALDPKFTEGRPYVYALYTYDHILGEAAPPPKWGKPKTTGDPCSEPHGADACLVSGRLVRLTAEGNPPHAKLESEGEPFQEVLAEGWCQQFSSHSIGDLEFGPEGDLYVSGGDGASFGSTPDYGQLGEPANPCGDPPTPAGVAPPAGTPSEPSPSLGGSLRAQNLENLGGKILRVDPNTGEGATGNPLSASASANTRRVVAEGFRNPFRFTLDPETGELYTDNVGSSQIEEIDRFAVPPTSIYNSGWPCYEGPVRQFQFKKLFLGVCERLYEEEEAGGEPTAKPFFYYSHGQSVVPEDECPIEYGSALGGISFYEGNSNYPSKYDGALFFTDTVRGCVYVMRPDSPNEPPDPLTAERFMRESRIYPAVDIEEGPEGNLYYADLFGNEEGTEEGAIHRITYEPGAPTARLTANPPYGSSLPLKITFDASKSSDTGEELLTYEWDLNGDGTFEKSGGETQSLEFTKSMLEEEEEQEESLNRVVAVRVTNKNGSSVARVTVYPGDDPPEPKIEKPLVSQKWKVGERIQLLGLAYDTEFVTPEHPNGEIFTPLSYFWSTRILHCPTGPTTCHAHPLQVIAGTRSGELFAPEHDYPSYLEITLRVADRRGLTASKTIKLEPRTVNLAVESAPPGVQLTAGLFQGTAPLFFTAIEGSHLVLSAPATAQLEGQTYSFSGWSDGGDEVHTIAANSSATYTARYAAPPPDLSSTVPASPANDNHPKVVGSAPAGVTVRIYGSAACSGSPIATVTPEQLQAGVGVDVPDDTTSGFSATDTTAAEATSGCSEPLTFVEDSTPPQTTIETHPSALTNSAAAEFTFSGSDSGGSGVASFECRRDGASFAPCSSPQSYASLSDGSHTFEVRAIDQASNADATPASFEWTVDTTPPQTTIETHPSALTNSAAAEFTFSGSDSGGSGVASFECRRDGASFAPCSSPQSYASLSDGSHTFEVRAIDQASNADATPASFEWTVDTTPPQTTIETHPSALTNSAAAEFTFSGSDSGGSGVASFECRRDGASFAPCSSPQSYASLSDGSHTFEVRAIDQASNADATPASFEWTVDTTPPQTTIGKHPAKRTRSSSAKFVFGADAAGAAFTCKLDGKTKLACRSPKSYKRLAPGKHTFKVWASASGLTDATPSKFSWKILPPKG